MDCPSDQSECDAAAAVSAYGMWLQGLQLLPSFVLIIFSWLEIRTPRTKQRTAHPLTLQIGLRFTVVVLLLGQTIYDLMRDMDSERRSVETLVTGVFEVLSLVWLIFLLLDSKSKGCVRSPVTWIYVLGQITVETVLFLVRGTLVTEWLLHEVLWVCLLILCSISDSNGRQDARNESPEDESSFLSFLTLDWLTRLAFRGVKEPLQVPDLQPLRPQEESTRVGRRLRHCLMTEDGKQRHSLSSALILAFAREHVIGVTLALAADAGNLINPFLLRQLLLFTGDGSQDVESGALIVLLMALCSVASNLSQNWHINYATRNGIRMRTALMDTVFLKSSTLCNSVRKDRNVGELVNLLSVDADRPRTLLEYGYVLISTPVVILIAGVILYLELGWSAVIGLVILSLCSPVTFLVSLRKKDVEASRLQAKDERISRTSEVLNSMKIVKLYAWEKAFMNIISGIRDRELRFVEKLDRWLIVPSLSSHGVMLVVVALTFMLYLTFDPNAFLTPANLFFSLAVLNAVRAPIGVTVQVLSALMSTRVAVKRISEFLQLKDRIETVTRVTDENDVAMKGATLSWFEDSDNAFKLNVESLCVKRGSLTTVIGSVGSGKSSLLSAILGDMRLEEGNINVSPDVQKIAYVPQQAWILNRSVKENILFGQELDEEKYRRVISCCQLEPDLKILPAGDETEIGEKGINLSGGQKQRISIARACYSDADLFLFDDPLSAVDAHVAKSLIDDVFSSKTGLLKKKTRILVTNNLTVLPEADQIMTMKSGTGLAAENLDQVLSDPELKMSISVVDEDMEEVQEKKAEDQAKNTGSPASGDLIKEEKKATGSVGASVYLAYFKLMPWLATAVLAQLVSQAFDAGIPVMLSLGSRLTPDQQQDSRWTESGIIGLFVLLSVVGYLIGFLITTRGVIEAARILHHRLLSSVMHAPIRFFETTPLARILNRFVTDMENMESKMHFTLLMLQSNFSQLAVSVVILLYVVPWFGILVLPITGFLYVIYKYGLGAERQVQRLVSTTQSLTYAHFTETMNGMSSIRAYRAMDTFSQLFQDRVDQNQKCSHSQAQLTTWRCLRLDLIGNLMVILTAVYAVWGKGSADPAFLGLAIVYAIKLPVSLNKLIRGIASVESQGVSIERVLEYLTLESEDEWESHADHKPPNDWPSKGAIAYDSYSARYRPGLDLVLNDLRFEINSKEKIGIVGRTGAGKSTISLSLFRLIEPASGVIRIDDVDIKSIGLHDLRSKLTIIPQDPVLFIGSIRSNMDPFDEKTDDQLWRCLESAHLADFVRSLDAGLEHPVSEGGDNLSVGQRQLLCLARALVRDTKILIMDEATAAVDTVTDSLIQKTIREEFKECTVLTIAHRLNTILDSDRVMVMDAGRVAEFDHPHVLLSDRNSMFFSLARDAGIVE